MFVRCLGLLALTATIGCPNPADVERSTLVHHETKNSSQQKVSVDTFGSSMNIQVDGVEVCGVGATFTVTEKRMGDVLTLHVHAEPSVVESASFQCHPGQSETLYIHTLAARGLKHVQVDIDGTVLRGMLMPLQDGAIDGDGWTAHEGKTVYGQMQREVGGRGAVVDAQTTIENGAFLMDFEKATDHGLYVQNAVIWIDLNDDGACDEGDVVRLMSHLPTRSPKMSSGSQDMQEGTCAHLWL